MRYVGAQVLLIFPLILAGCTSSSNDLAVKNAELSPVTSEDTSANAPEANSPEPATHVSPMKSWTPKYIQTGLASGIMVEFTGVKKDKPLHARYAGIELRRYPAASDPADHAPDRASNQLTLNAQGNDFVPAPFDVDRAEPIVLTTSINDVKQAFFKVPPGAYVFRQAREWADQSYIGGVIVRDGSYSVIMIPVKIPGAGQP
jgi:hypothetical protein